MRIFDIIQRKKNGFELSKEEICFVVKGFTSGEIPDYQMSALLMAICLKGMTMSETLELTMAMAYSGETVDLSEIKGVKVDKHSTGGVGDKTTLIVSPIVAACGVPVAKMSGRGLGHTGGTIDKLESIRGLRTAFSPDEFVTIVNKTGICIAGQSGDLAPADKKLYALRDVTATVDSIPLIAASVMSKKIAAGADRILLDVKAGSGAFMKTVSEAERLAETMVCIGNAAGRKTVALITNMDRPLGKKIGNSLEVIEAVETLKGNGPGDLTEICVALAANMLELAGKGDIITCEKMAKNALESGMALEKLCEMVVAQDGDEAYIRDTSLFPVADFSEVIISNKGGYIHDINAEGCGIAGVMLGTGRETVTQCIDYSAGIELCKKNGEYVNPGDVLAIMYTSSKDRLEPAKKLFVDSVHITESGPESKLLIYKKIE